MTLTHLRWGSDELSLLVSLDPVGPARLLAVGEASGLPDPGREPERCERLVRSALPVVEVQVAGGGRLGTSGKRHVDGALSRSLRCTGHEEEDVDGVRTLRVRMADGATGLRVTAVYRLRAGIPVLHAEAHVENGGGSAVTLEYVSSLALANLARGLPPGARWEDGLSLWLAANPWSGEFRWSRATLAERGLYDVGMVAYGQTGSKNRVAVTSTGAWSSSEYLPMGCLEETAGGRALLWQIEHNGSWHAELGDRFDDVYLSLSGPTDREHHWRRRLAPGDSFRTVPAAVALVPEGGLDAAVGALTAHRRATRRPHPDHDRLPVVFNDFMNSLMGEPGTEALLPLVDAAAAAGAEVFCVDAGWYDAEPPGTVGPGGVPGWWDAVGEWEESPSRFPGGLREVLDRIREAGMVPGLWLEPEVVGVRSPVAALPDEAFFRRDGVRLVEWGRHQLDLRHPAARAHLDTVVDRLVRDYGVGYLKLDHNIDIGAGTDGPHGTDSPGDGLLGHNRAHLAWLDGVLDRHPGLVLESCAAGGSRTDHAILSRLPIHSVTDQQDFRLLPAVAAAAPSAVTPEQGAVWAYPQPEHTAAELSTVLVSAMLGRVHLSGRPDLLDPEQSALVRAALATYKTYRHLLPTARPHWPLGLPGWRDDRLALALTADGGTTLLALWRRDGAPGTVTLALPRVDGRPRVLFEAAGPTVLDWDESGRVLRAALPAEGSAVLIAFDGSPACQGADLSGTGPPRS
ncbi:glycoside hydrolase family 36 protein [Streptomyces sp. MB09-02B]|uniref:glycoside hydrolase family 36 protein n=1 Tax=Streptomyces sp. MB09-02B TaxID=3028667 RepID=UPI0029AE2CE3|nr:glycoside hydrolase family 36 protein [Streptomyces sp. MB09-02B]MDX3641779.1 alpha-galactosidase [Streptomyces sp. MB09-02B]